MKSPNFQLSLQTSNLIIGFMVWVILSSLMPYIKADIPLTAGQISMVTAVPVILGSILRIPIGYWTNRFEQENYSLLVLFYYYFLFYISVANSMMDLIIGGLFVGIGGAVFSVGVTSLPKYFPKESHGFVNGIYGVGNAGTAITSF